MVPEAGGSNLRIGDQVRDGSRLGTVIDVGTVLVQVKTSDGHLRVLCPWELVRIRGTEEPLASPPRAKVTYGSG
jgi:hypothetical protein